ncbi:MAG: DUF3298 domain-containing protein [Brevundimonas sp.]
MIALRALMLTTAAAAALAGCNRDRETDRAEAPAPAPAPAVIPAEAGAPMSFEDQNPYADVRLTLPAALKPQADLHARLYAQEVRALRQFTEGAQGELTEAGVDADQPKFQKTVAIIAAAETGKLLSLKRVDYEYSGGAHPNTRTSGLLWDKALKRRVALTTLFRTGADLGALDQALCAAINAARRARVPGAAPIALGGPAGAACPRAADTGFVLAPGSVGGKAAGLIFLINPYQVGPHAEGGYEIALPATTFRSLLAVAYVDEFAGQLIKAGDVTPAPAAAAAPAQSARN